MIKSGEGKALGMEVSMLERLMNCDMYQTKPRDPRLITKLVQNYRSHRKLLEVPSRLFYEGELLACSERETVTAQPVLRLLPWAPSDTFPVLFHQVLAPHAKPPTPHCKSLHNPAEVEVVLGYLKHLLGYVGRVRNLALGQANQRRENGRTVEPGRIGVVTPYRKQATEIRRAMKRELPASLDAGEIQVGTTERFQVKT